MKKILIYHNGSGAAYWRLIDPLMMLPKDEFQVTIADGGVRMEQLEEYDIYCLQSIVDKEGIAKMYYMQQEKGKKIVCDIDDAMEINEDNPHAEEHKMTDAVYVIGQTLKIADMITTTTPYLANRLKKYNDNIQILPNYMDMGRWGGPVRPNVSKEIRIGWMGSITHLNDIKMVVPTLKRILGEYPNVKLVLMGDIRFKDLFDSENVEVRLGVPFDVYPAILRGLQLDIGICPLLDTEFNRAKSNIKALEMALVNVPCIASDVEPYKKSLAYKLAKTEDDWYEQITDLIKREGKRRQAGKKAHNRLLNEYDLSYHIGDWIDSYNSLYYNKDVSQTNK